MAYIIHLGKIALGLLVKAIALTLPVFLDNLFQHLLPWIRSLMPLVHEALQTLATFLRLPAPLATSAVKWAMKYLHEKILGIIGSYRSLANNDVQMDQDIFVMNDDGILQRISAKATVSADELPESIRSKLRQKGHVEAYHDTELVEEVKRRVRV